MTDNIQSLQTDTTSRNRIVEETDKNFFVEAGAGSGKTTMLVNRMVAMVEQGKDIRKICAITFTKAAAGEFYERFQRILVERSNPYYNYVNKGHAGQLPPPTDKTRKRCAEALQNIDLCFMGTIDSFCNMILSEHPSEAKIPSDAAIMSDEAAQIMYKQEFVKICKGEYGQRLADYAKALKKLNDKTEEAFVKGMHFFMNNRNVHMNYVQAPLVDVDSKYAAARAEIIQVLKVACEHLEELTFSYSKPEVDAKEVVRKACFTLRRNWGNNVPYVISALERLAEVSFSTDITKYGVSYGTYFVSEPLFTGFALKGKNGLIRYLKYIQYHTSMTFLGDCVPVIEKAMREKGHMTYFDYLYYLRNMVKADAEAEGKLIRYIYNRHSYFLIDEFQDTNPMQAEVFFYLASENPVSRWQDCIPRQGSLFIVGDPKQSIYRFRSADVASYLNVKKLFENPDCGEVLYLSRNFRSRKILCELFNTVFKQTLKASTNQSAFTEIPIVEDKEAEFEGFYRYKTYTPKYRGTHREYMDEYQIGKIIQTLVNNEQYKIKDEEEGGLRKIKFGDIMIITPTKANLPVIMNYLDELNIPVRVEGKVMFEANEALKEVYTIYRALADSKDKIALYGALTGKCIGISNEEILKFTELRGELSVYNLQEISSESASETEPVYSELCKIKRLQTKALQLSPAALFSMIMDEFQIYEHVDADNLEVLYYTLELLRSAEKEGIISAAQDTVAYIAKLLSGNTDEERCLSLDSERDCVHMANLHKVKGLEAPVVILAYSWPPRHTPASRVEYTENGPEGYLFTLYSDEKYTSGFGYKEFFSTTDYKEQQEKETGDCESEDRRLVYVAATRARNVLIVSDSATINRYGNDWYQSRWKDLLGEIKTDFFAECKPAQTQINASAMQRRMQLAYDLYQKAKRECALTDRSAENKTYQVELPSHVKVASKLAADEEELVAGSQDVVNVEAMTAVSEEVSTGVEGTTMNFSVVHRCPELLGTMVHRLMEMMVSAKGRTDAKDAADEIIREYMTAAYEDYSSALRETLVIVAGQMRNGGYVQNNAVPKDILNTLLTADEVYTEVPFCYKEENAEVIWNGVMDVIYCVDGKWHIVDYKTNLDGSNLDETYRGQMEAYVKAFKALTGEDADALTYHIEI